MLMRFRQSTNTKSEKQRAKTELFCRKMSFLPPKMLRKNKSSTRWNNFLFLI